MISNKIDSEGVIYLYIYNEIFMYLCKQVEINPL